MRLTGLIFVVFFLVGCGSGSSKGTCTLSGSGMERVHNKVSKSKCSELGREMADEIGGFVFVRWEPN